MIVNRFDNPEYREAVKRETDRRDAAFLAIPANVCGIEIRQMTARDFLILDGLGNSMLSGGPPSPGDILDFLWRMSTRYSDRCVARWWFKWKYRRLNWPKAYMQIRLFLDVTLMDCTPGSGNSTRAGIAGWLAYLTDWIASQYGWTLEQVMSIPLRVLYQQLRCIEHRLCPNAFIPNPSDKVTHRLAAERDLANARAKLLTVLARRTNG